MRITHLCLGCPFPDGFSYQENMLPKYHMLLEHDVSVIASLQTFNKDGKVSYYESPSEYINENGIPIIRLAFRSPQKIYRKLKRFIGLYEALEKTAPEVIFIHGCQFMDMDVVVKYLKRHSGVSVYVDNHADFFNSAKNYLSHHILHQILWKHCAKIIAPFTVKFYGVLPARVDFLKDVYKVPADQIELLTIGAQDELVTKYENEQTRSKIREIAHCGENSLLIVTGGKINSNRPETLNLMQAVSELGDMDVKLLVFGVVDQQLKAEFDRLCQSDTITYVGWLTAEQTYEYIAGADMVVFPGLHSVMWEQAVAQGKPCIFRKLKGFDHVVFDHNAVLCDDVSAEGLRKCITSVIGDRQVFEAMKRSAEQSGRKQFFYSEIAKRCVQ